MIAAILSLLGCQLAGEVIRQLCDLPIPGPVVGMFLLALVLASRNRRPDAVPAQLETTAETLIAHMGLLFVPAGVGIIAEAGLLRAEWLPIFAALLGSTMLSIAVTGLVMHRIIHVVERREAIVPALACQKGSRS